jgi:pathogenesis-related protein 1
MDRAPMAPYHRGVPSLAPSPSRSRARGALLLALALACGGAGAGGSPAGATDGGGGGADGGGDGGQACTAGSDGCALLDAHNRVRAAAQPAPVPALEPLSWSDAAAQAAGDWARGCAWYHDPTLSARGLGQNLYAASYPPTPDGVVASWASEAADYDRATNTCAPAKVCGHYTQLVWRSTRQVGCATVRCTTGSPFPGGGAWWYVACDYAPPGNYVGQRPY